MPRPRCENIISFYLYRRDLFLDAGRVTVETELGAVVGQTLPGGVQAFLGIPYALPPVGKLRFEPPVPLASWGDKLEAFEFEAECIQSAANNPSESFMQKGAPPNVCKS